MNGLGSTFIIVSILSRSIFKVRTWLTDARSILMIFRMWKMIHLTESCHYGRPRWLKIGQDGRKLPSWTRPSELCDDQISSLTSPKDPTMIVLGPREIFPVHRVDPALGRSYTESYHTTRMWFDFFEIICLLTVFSYCIIEELEYVQ